MHEHLKTNGVAFQMLMMLKQVASIFFFFFLPKNNLPATEITFPILCDAWLLGGFTSTNSTLWHKNHLLSLAAKQH